MLVNISDNTFYKKNCLYSNIYNIHCIVMPTSEENKMNYIYKLMYALFKCLRGISES